MPLSTYKYCRICWKFTELIKNKVAVVSNFSRGCKNLWEELLFVKTRAFVPLFMSK